MSLKVWSRRLILWDDLPSGIGEPFVDDLFSRPAFRFCAVTSLFLHFRSRASARLGFFAGPAAPIVLFGFAFLFLLSAIARAFQAALYRSWHCRVNESSKAAQ
jgi:hypothetical protein